MEARAEHPEEPNESANESEFESEFESELDDLESLTLEQLDEAFQAGAIDVATLIRLQCSPWVPADPH